MKIVPTPEFEITENDLTLFVAERIFDFLGTICCKATFKDTKSEWFGLFEKEIEVEHDVSFGFLLQSNNLLNEFIETTSSRVRVWIDRDLVKIKDIYNLRECVNQACTQFITKEKIEEFIARENRESK